MGVGHADDFFDAIESGLDLFDCVTPTRHGPHASRRSRARGTVNLRNTGWKDDPSPLDPACDCTACAGFGKGTLRHLCASGEMLGAMLLTMHNLRFFHRLLERIRAAIAEDRLLELRAEILAPMTGRLSP
jgi:queuine tRNA-ribosyltransferase